MSDATAMACTRAIVRMLGVLAHNVGMVAMTGGAGMQFDPVAEADAIIAMEGIGAAPPPPAAPPPTRMAP